LDSSERIFALRNLFSKKPSTELFQDILQLFRNCAEEDVQLELQYALEHIKEWPSYIQKNPPEDWSFKTDAQSAAMLFITKLYTTPQISEETLQACADSPTIRHLEAVGNVGRLHISNAVWSDFLLSPHLQNLKELTLTYLDFSADELKPLLESDGLSGLIKLCLDNNRLTDSEFALLANASSLNKLERLFLQGNNIKGRDFGSFAQSEICQSLKLLCLADNELNCDALMSLAKSPYLRALEELHLHGNHIKGRGVEALARSPICGNLRTLEFGDSDQNDSFYLYHKETNSIGKRGAIAIANSPYLKKLQGLDLLGNGVEDEGAAALLNSKVYPDLLRMMLRRNHLTAKLFDSVETLEHFPRLRTLDLSENEVGIPGLSALLKTPNLPPIWQVMLVRNQITDKDLETLLTFECPRVPDELYLDENDITDAGLLILTESPICKEIECLSLGRTKVTGEGVLRLNLYELFPKMGTFFLDGIVCFDEEQKALEEKFSEIEFYFG